MQRAGAGWHLICTLDDIAWLLNLRGSDVPYSPVFVAHVLIGPTSTTLFVSADKVPAPLQARLAADGIELAGYPELGAHLGQLPAGSVMLIDPRRVTAGILQSLPASVRVVEELSPT